MRTFSFWGWSAAALLAIGSLPVSPASAHINMVGPLQGRGANSDQKKAPCEGTAWGSGTVYTFQPGTTITLTVAEAVAHDSYFRIAFDGDGDASFQDPASIAPINPNRV